MSQDQTERPTLRKPDFDAIRDPETMLLSLVGWYDGLHGLYLWAKARVEADKNDMQANKDLKKYAFAQYPGAHVRNAGINDGMRQAIFYKDEDDTAGYRLRTPAIMELTNRLVEEGKLFKRTARGGPMLSTKPFPEKQRRTRLFDIDV